MRKLLLATTAAAFVASAGTAMAQETDSFTLTATATVQEAISVDCATPTISFGTFALGSTLSAVEIVVDSGGTTANGSGAVVVSAGNMASCTISGVDGDDATASIDTPLDLTLDGGTDVLSAAFTLSQSSAIADNTTITIGGTLTVPDGFNTTHAFGIYQNTGVTLTVTDPNA